MGEQLRLRLRKHSSREQVRSSAAALKQGFEPAPSSTAFPRGHAFARLRVAYDAPPAGSIPPGEALPFLQRQLPSALQPPELFKPYRPGEELRLHLDPRILAMALQYLQRRLDPTQLQVTLSRIFLSSATTLPASPAAPGPVRLSWPVTLPPVSAPAPGPRNPAVPNPFTRPAPPPMPPSSLVPRRAGPELPRKATLFHVLSAISKLPAMKQALTRLSTQALLKLSHDWKRLRTSGQISAVSEVVVIGLSALGGVTSDPSILRLPLSLLNGTALSVPGMSWMGLELNTADDNLMLGVHVDVGALLSPSLLLKESSPETLGVPPTRESLLPTSLPGQRGVQRWEAEPAEPAREEQLARRIQAATGGGSRLDSSARRYLEAGLRADLSRVRIHTDGEADQLARSVSAEAFTTGQDIFFRAGTYDLHSADGLRLLAHEATHTVQQAAGPVSGTPSVGGVALSDPSDDFEQKAQQTARQLVARMRTSLTPAERESPFRHRFSALRIWPGVSGVETFWRRAGVPAPISWRSRTLCDECP